MTPYSISSVIHRESVVKLLENFDYEFQ